MENKINIAKLLKNCPENMELDCTIYDEVYFSNVSDRKDISFPIKVIRKDGNSIVLTRYGQVINKDFAKCVIFPKGKTTWEGFVPPVNFNDGDIVITTLGDIAIISNEMNNKSYNTYCELFEYGTFIINDDCVFPERLATEEEKQRLFDAIEENGYKWNFDTKTLEKLSKFKVGDKVKHISTYTLGIVVKVDDKGYYIDYPKGEGVCYISFELEKDYELAPNKFDITTLKPFDKVLVRNDDNRIWEGNFLSCYYSSFYVCAGGDYRQCIPYKDNEHLLGENDDCDDFYKTWEE